MSAQLQDPSHRSRADRFHGLEPIGRQFAGTTVPLYAQGSVGLAGADRITNLCTRPDLLAGVQARLSNARRLSSRLALLCIDLDHFAVVCSIIGTAAGDRVLQEVGDRLGRSVRAADLVARVGSDEFVVVLDGLARGADSAAVAARMLDVIGQRIDVTRRSMTLHASIGIALYPDDSASADSLLLQASVAMKRAKQRGRARLAFNLPS